MLLGELPVVTPFPWPRLLAYLSHRLIPEVESVDAVSYSRRIGRRTLVVNYDAANSALQVSADGRLKKDEALQNIAALFDTRHAAQAVTEHLRRSPLLAARINAVPGLRPLGAWSPLELCVRTILGQQVTVAAARTLMRRLVQRCGEVTATNIIAADFTGIGMPGKRVQTVLTLAQAMLDARVRFDRPWPVIDAALKELPGFGPWTRSYLAIRLGREADAFAETDLGLIRAANVESPQALLALAEPWRPYRAYAATYLWAVSNNDLA